jgi:gluconokinase
MPVSLVESQFAALEPLRSEERGLVVDAAQPPDAIVTATVAAIVNAASTYRG